MTILKSLEILGGDSSYQWRQIIQVQNLIDQFLRHFSDGIIELGVNLETQESEQTKWRLLCTSNLTDHRYRIEFPVFVNHSQ